MWTVLLVEDEVFLRKSIIEIIDWEKEGFTVIGEAGDGVEAFELMKQRQPDLVISDIVMPNMDGIELLKKSREEEWDCKFVMLTCMSDFEYARQAVEFGASNYILKLSMEVEALRDTLSAIKEVLEKENRKISLSINDAYNGYWQRLIGEKHDGQEQAQALDFYKDNKLIIVSVLHNESCELTGDVILANNLLCYEGKPIIHTFSQHGHTTFFIYSKGPVHVNVQGEMTGSVVFSKVVSVKELLPTWALVLQGLNDCWYYKKKGIFCCPTEKETPVPLSTPWKLERDLVNAFEEGRLETCISLIEEIWKYMVRYRFSFISVKKKGKWIHDMFAKIANKKERERLDANTHEELKLQLITIASNYLKNADTYGELLTDHPQVNRIIQYVKANCEKNISVKSLAKFVSMDENYVSGLFKKKTGQSLIQFIHGTRVERAKFYLENHGDLTISEIGDRIGFANDNYFIKIFKRFTKQTPSQYRKSCADGKEGIGDAIF